MGITEIMYSYAVCISSIILIAIIAYLQLKFKKTDVRQWCILFVTCALISNISIMFQILNIQNYDTWSTYEAYVFIGQAMLPICIYFAIAYYIEPNFRFKNRYLLLFYIPIITIICMFTDSYHGLMFKDFSVNYKNCTFGYMFYVYIIDVYLIYALGLLMILKYLKKKDLIKRSYKSILFAIIPLAMNVLCTFGIIPSRIYITGIWQSIFSITIIYIIFKFQILSQLPLAIDSILNIVSDSYIVINDKREIRLYNRIFQQTYNLGKLNILGMNIDELIEYKEFDTIEKKDIDKILKLKNFKDRLTFERTSKTLNKTLRYKCEFFEVNKKEKLYLIVIYETTEHSRSINALKLSNDAIIGKERLLSLGQMIGGIAHNLKTPIFSIAGALEGLEELTNEYESSIGDKQVLPEDHKAIAQDMFSWTDKIKSYLSYMTDVIQAIQIQTTSSSKSVDEKFTINELIKYINILMKYELKRNSIDLKINIQVDKKMEVHGNLNVLVQVLNNLISNSIQAYKDETNKIIELNLYKKEKKLYIEVRDYAGGIPKEVQSKLFKEMVTTKGKDGTGLGLFISYTNIKTEFNGNITFYSKDGGGTIFRIIIPVKK